MTRFTTLWIIKCNVHDDMQLPFGTNTPDSRGGQYCSHSIAFFDGEGGMGLLEIKKCNSKIAISEMLDWVKNIILFIYWRVRKKTINFATFDF